MSEIQKQDLTSMNIAEEQLRKLKELFPEAFTEGLSVDWDKLRLTLGQNIDVGKERYGMNWPGKADCFKTIQQPSIATLFPARDESVNFDTTENLFIEGDNLEVLKLLQKSYLGQIKIMYFDPPYNTGKEFIYPDNYSESLDTYLEYTGQVDSDGKKFGTNTDTDGRYHSKWMNMMYPRLFLAKNLLADDGVIFISIDDNEFHNLKALCNEIFGEENFFADMVVVRSEGGGLAKKVIKGHDYLLVYTKSVSNFKGIYRPKDIRGKIVEVEGREFWIEEDWLRKEFGKYGTCLYEEIVEIKGIEKKKEIDKGLEDGIYRLLKKENGHIVGRLRALDEDGSKFYSILKHLNKTGIDVLKDLDLNEFFDFPKPLSLIKELILGASIFSKNDENIILDIFAGSGTTAHAVLEQNFEDGGNRKFICVQIPEPNDKETKAFKAGYNTIADLSKERIKRAAKHIVKKSKSKEASGEINFNLDKEQNLKLDLGFKVFKLSKSNFKIWDSTLEKEPEVIQAKLFEHIQHISPEAEQEAILYELLLKSGFQLTTPIEKLSLAGKTVFSIAEGQLLICLEKELTHDCIKAMAEMQPTRVICLDEGFKGENADALKTNAVQIMKSKGVVNFRTV